MTKLCVPITATTCEQMGLDARTAITAGAEMIELRLDHLDFSSSFDELNKALVMILDQGTPVILTCRVAEEGGQYRGDERARRQLLEHLYSPRSYIDLEYAGLRRSAWNGLTDRTADHNVADLHLILSRHDFEKTPEGLGDLLKEISAERCEVAKLACKANTIADAVRMLDALRESVKRKPTIALSMGEAGVITRVLAKKFGAFLTFASLDEGKESAPGQLTVSEMRSVYRWDAIGPATQVYGVIGCPVAHSMSPHIHNAAFTALGHDGVYLHLRVEPGYESFAAFLDACLQRPWLDLRGCSVTIPHKENLLRYVREHGGTIEPLAERIGAANTLVITPRETPAQSEIENQKSAMLPQSAIRNPQSAIGGLAAYNTDYAGALDALCTGLNCDRKGLAEYSFAVLGAGGAARAIVAGLTNCGARVTIFNRTLAKAEALAKEFGTHVGTWNHRPGPDARVIINCTSVGMWPQTDHTPLPVQKLREDAIVLDTIANPTETLLLREAQNLGCKTIDGLTMFINQAAAQFKLWTGKDAPADLMRQVVLSRLGATT